MTSRYFFTIVFLFVVIGCNRPNKTTSESTKSDAPSGTWYYKAYIDSTVQTKKIYDYSWTCASYAFEITFNNNNPDSCYFKGYHEEWMLPVKRVNDSTYHAGEDSIQYWIITFSKNSNLTLKEFRDKSMIQPADPHVYFFEKRNERIGDIKKYFVKNILSGVYRDSIKEITLSDNYSVSGFDSLTSFDIELDFWEMAPQMDLIYLQSKNENLVRYNWTFKEKQLILKKVHTIYDEHGDWDGGVADTIVYVFDKIK